jgi:hypothetical protein
MGSLTGAMQGCELGASQVGQSLVADFCKQDNEQFLTEVIPLCC